MQRAKKRGARAQQRIWLCVLCDGRGRGARQASSRVWAASELRHSVYCRAQRALALVQRALARVQRALASERSERWLACIERWRARSEHQLAWCLAKDSSNSDATQRMGCAHMASDGCVRVAHGRAMRRVFALRLDRFECLI